MSEEITEQLLKLVKEVSEPSGLLASSMESERAELYLAAVEQYGSWEATLAHLLWNSFKKQSEASTSQKSPQVEVTDEAERARHPQADEPVLGITTGGELIRFEATHFPLVRESVSFALPEAHGMLHKLRHIGSLTDVLLFSKQGLYFGVMQGMLPDYESLTSATSLLGSLELQENDGILTVFRRGRFSAQRERLIHVTRQGKCKVTDLKEYTQTVGRQGREAFLLNDGDEALEVLIGEEWGGLFCASSAGLGIHVHAHKIRSMGRKSVGVNIMRLDGPEDTIVSAFLTRNIEEFAVITAEGYGKRLQVQEFRIQGRGGAGMQVLRLNPQDRVVAVVPCSFDSDLVLCTNQNRIFRYPAYRFAQMGRSARGKKILELQQGEEVIGLSRLPCAGSYPFVQEKSNAEDSEATPENVGVQDGFAGEALESLENQEGVKVVSSQNDES